METGERRALRLAKAASEARGAAAVLMQGVLLEKTEMERQLRAFYTEEGKPELVGGASQDVSRYGGDGETPARLNAFLRSAFSGGDLTNTLGVAEDGGMTMEPVAPADANGVKLLSQVVKVFVESQQYGRALEHAVRARAMLGALEKAMQGMSTGYIKQAATAAALGTVAVGVCMQLNGFLDEALDCATAALKNEALLADEKSAVGEEGGVEEGGVALSMKALALLAGVYLEKSDLYKSIEHANRALRVIEVSNASAAVDDRPLTPTDALSEVRSEVLGHLASAYFQLKEYPKALEFYQQELRVEVTLFGAGHVKTAGALGMIGVAYEELGQAKRGLECNRRALEIQTATLGAKCEEVALSCTHIARSHHNRGEYSEAVKFYQQAVDAYTHVFGGDHPTTAKAKEGLADATDRMAVKREVKTVELVLGEKLGVRIDNERYVTKVIPQGQLEQKGIELHDRINSIGGIDCREMTDKQVSMTIKGLKAKGDAVCTVVFN
jgi:tetratricopeptide (TPR) repeat protein